MSEATFTKKCPFCAEEIRQEAIKCKHCGSDLLDDRKSNKENKLNDSVLVKENKATCLTCGNIQYFNKSDVRNNLSNSMHNFGSAIFPFMPQRSVIDFKKCQKCGSRAVEIKEQVPVGLMKKKIRIPKSIKSCLILFFGFYLIIIIIAMLTDSDKKTEDKNIKSDAVNISTATENSKEVAPVKNAQIEKQKSKVDEINSIVDNIGSYEVTIWESNGDMAKSTSDGPFEVIVNAGPGKISGCSAAKNVLYEIMKGLYTSPVSDSLIRVKFTAFGYLKASLGSSDAVGVGGKPLTWSGPTNFWTVTNKYRSYEDESSSLSSRTYGVNINCY